MWMLIPDWVKRAVAALVLVAALAVSFVIWLTVHDIGVRAAAVKGMVSEYRATSAEAERDELARQVSAGKIVIDAYQVQLRNVRAKEEATANDLEKRITENEALRKASGRACTLDDVDSQFLLKP